MFFEQDRHPVASPSQWLAMCLVQCSSDWWFIYQNDPKNDTCRNCSKKENRNINQNNHIFHTLLTKLTCQTPPPVSAQQRCIGRVNNVPPAFCRSNPPGPTPHPEAKEALGADIGRCHFQLNHVKDSESILPSGERLHSNGKSPCYWWENPL